MSVSITSQACLATKRSLAIRVGDLKTKPTARCLLVSEFIHSIRCNSLPLVHDDIRFRGSQSEQTEKIEQLREERSYGYAGHDKPWVRPRRFRHNQPPRCPLSNFHISIEGFVTVTLRPLSFTRYRLRCLPFTGLNRECWRLDSQRRDRPRPVHSLICST